MSNPIVNVTVDCTIVELEPAVIDAAGNVIRPPVLQMPQVVSAPLTDDELADLQTRIDAYNQKLSDEATAAAAAALVALRMIRDRWLAQTDYIEVYLANPTGFSPLPTPIQDAITANKDGWVAWRQALRDLPAANSLDQVAAVAAVSTIHATTDTFPTPWPQPPASPVIHLT